VGALGRADHLRRLRRLAGEGAALLGLGVEGGLQVLEHEGVVEMPTSLVESPDAASPPSRREAALRRPPLRGEQASSGEREFPLMARLGDRPVDVNRTQETIEVSLLVHQPS
jgi:hypothetical protein